MKAVRGTVRIHRPVLQDRNAAAAEITTSNNEDMKNTSNERTTHRILQQKYEIKVGFSPFIQTTVDFNSISDQSINKQ